MPGHAPHPAAPFTRAATALWLAAGGLLLFGGCVSAALAAMASTPWELLADSPAVDAMPPDDCSRLRQVHGAAGTAALATSALLVLPAATLLGFGFAVRRGHTKAATSARVLCLIIAVLLGFWTLASLNSGVAALPIVLVQGGLIALLWRAGGLLRADRLQSPYSGAPPTTPAPAAGRTDNDPWDAML